MPRLVVFFLLMLALWLALELLARRLRRRGRGEPVPNRRRAGSTAAVRLVRCDACGVHVPEARLLTARSGRFCSQRCRERVAAAAD